MKMNKYGATFSAILNWFKVLLIKLIKYVQRLF